MNVFISQSDVVTGYGWGLDRLWNGLLGGVTSIRPTDRFADRGFVSRQAAMIPGLETAPGTSRVMAMLERLLAPLRGRIDPLTTLILATTVGEIEYVEEAILAKCPALASQSDPRCLLERIRTMLGLRGEGMVVSSACASSAAALTQAAALVHEANHQQVLVVACDALSEFVYSGFSTLLSLSEEPARPFDANRSGLSLGEAAAWALVTPTSESFDRPAVSILGWGNSSDAIHMTAPDRNAGGLSRAIKKACAMAKRPSEEISFIAAHGTATQYSDAMEMCAFRETIKSARPVFSIKGAIGHTLAAAGLTQILVAGRALLSGLVPPTVGMIEPDPAARGWVSSEPVQINSPRIALSTNSGFGGVNSAILLGKEGES